MPQPRHIIRERIAAPCSEFLWLVLTDEIDPFNDERLNRGGELEVQFGDEAFEYAYGDGLDKVADNVFTKALAAYVHAHPGRRPSWWWANAPEDRLSEGCLLESQAAFLRRVGLLTAAESRRLKPHDYEPVHEPAIMHDHLPMPCNCDRRARALL
jgi:hypothetical protein